MDAKATEAALVRAVPLVNALEAKGVEQWAAFRIAADCMPVIDTIVKAVEDIQLMTGARLSTREVLALIAECLNVPALDGDRPVAPAVDQVLVRKLALSIHDFLPRLPSSRGIFSSTNVSHVLDLVLMTEKKFRKTRGLGKLGLKRVKNTLEATGLSLGMSLDDATIAAVRAEIELQQATTR